MWRNRKRTTSAQRENSFSLLELSSGPDVHRTHTPLQTCCSRTKKRKKHERLKLEFWTVQGCLNYGIALVCTVNSSFVMRPSIAIITQCK